MIFCYCFLVWSLLEYSSILWDPFMVADSFHLERIQRRFCFSVVFILKIFHRLHDFSSVMDKFGLTSLADRRMEANLVFLHKLIDRCVGTPSLPSQINFRVIFHSTKFNSLFVVPFHIINYT